MTRYLSPEGHMVDGEEARTMLRALARRMEALPQLDTIYRLGMVALIRTHWESVAKSPKLWQEILIATAMEEGVDETR
jgi:hypothetical protein